MSTSSKGNQSLDQFFSLMEIQKQWNENVKNTLDAYLKIPNVSPSFDSNWIENGFMQSAMDLYASWAKENSPANAEIFLQNLEGRTPLLVVDIPAREYNDNDVVILYGHLDKQPPMTGWDEGVEPFAPTYIGDKLYGRGGADDGYALFSAMLSCKFLEDNEISHARLVIVIEASEESGSPDLPAHLEAMDSTLTSPLGNVSLVVCLDSGCLDYDHLWITQSLRGLLQINVTVKVLEQGMHSGGVGGIVPSATHILRELIDRVSEPGTGKILLPELHVEIAPYIRNAAKNVAEILDKDNPHSIPFAPEVEPLKESVADQIIANTFEPVLEIIGIEGVPAIADAGNVLRPQVTLALSFRLPPGVDPQVAAAAVAEKLVEETPFNAQVSVVVDSLASGWAAPEPQHWLLDANEKASRKYFGESVQFMGEGGTIPFMAMLGEKYPTAQFMVTGVLGPGSNAHGPNEFLHIPTAHKITGCVSTVLVAHAKR